MRFKTFMERWQGIFLILVGSAASIWLAATKQLNLYIHPRYIIFTTIMAATGLLFGFLSFRYDTDIEKTRITRLQKFASIGVVLICILSFISLLVIKPATLTTATVNQRGINSGIGAGIKTSNAVPLFGGGDYSSFGVKDWASLLIQTNEPSFFSGKTADITGFISPDTDDPQNVFYVSRFVITCCAVDARPIGVPVYAPNWQADHKADGWVDVEGGFTTNPSVKSQQRIVIQPTKITNVEQPKDPYVY